MSICTLHAAPIKAWITTRSAPECWHLSPERGNSNDSIWSLLPQEKIDFSRVPEFSGTYYRRPKISATLSCHCYRMPNIADGSHAARTWWTCLSCRRLRTRGPFGSWIRVWVQWTWGNERSRDHRAQKTMHHNHRDHQSDVAALTREEGTLWKETTWNCTDLCLRECESWVVAKF